jgi:hypothetical protein
MCQNYQPFSGMKLLDHDPLFSKYIRTSRTTGRQVVAFYSIRMVCAQELGYGYSRGPFELYMIILPGDSSTSGREIIDTESNMRDFDRSLAALGAYN